MLSLPQVASSYLPNFPSVFSQHDQPWSIQAWDRAGGPSQAGFVGGAVGLCFLCCALNRKGTRPLLHQERQPINLLNLLSPLRGKGMGLLKGNVITPAMSATLHISEAADGSPRRVVTLLTTSLMLSSFSKNLNNCPVPWVYWTWFVLQVGKQL